MTTEVLKYNQIIAGPLATNERLKYMKRHFNLELGFMLMRHMHRIGGKFEVSIGEFKITTRAYNTLIVSQEVYVTQIEEPQP